MKNVFLLFSILLSAVMPAPAEPISEHIRDAYLKVDASEVLRLEKAESLGLMEIRTVILPEGENLWGKNFHFGWPVAAMIEETIIVVSRRHIYHSACGELAKQPKRDEYSGCFYVRSTDAGRTWGPMVDLVPLFADGGPGIGGMACIGVSGDTFLIKRSDPPDSGQGILASKDRGRTWTLYADAFAGLNLSVANVGPAMPEHPEFGMMIFNGVNLKEYGPAAIRYSRDGGRHWSETAWDTNASQPGEPAALIWDKNILLISRDFNPAICDDGKTWGMSQHLYIYREGDGPEDIRFVTRRSNIEGNRVAGHWANDTADICFNPVTRRIEVLHSARFGGGPGYDGNGVMVPMSTLLLWSIDPEDLLAGSSTWRFEGTLMVRNDHRGGCSNLDGLHPGGALVDVEHNVQRIYIYAGGPGGSKNGLFEITRTLDTPRLREYLTSTVPNFKHRKTIKVDDIPGKGYYAVTLMPDDYAYSEFKPDGSDIYFTDTEQYRLKHKIVKWDAQSGSVVWVQSSRVNRKAERGTILMHWGDKKAYFHQYFSFQD